MHTHSIRTVLFSLIILRVRVFERALCVYVLIHLTCLPARFISPAKATPISKGKVTYKQRDVFQPTWGSLIWFHTGCILDFGKNKYCNKEANRHQLCRTVWHEFFLFQYKNTVDVAPWVNSASTDPAPTPLSTPPSAIHSYIVRWIRNQVEFLIALPAMNVM